GSVIARPFGGRGFFHEKGKLVPNSLLSSYTTPTDIPPDATQSNEFAATYQDFTTNITARLTEIQQQAFDYYRKYYAKFYEDTAQSGEAPLGIDTVEKHNPYIKDIGYLRLSDGGILRITIHYDLDTEHGLEVKFVNGQVADTGGIADT
ncbi:MAG: DUF6985 domain-containing protein, partial [Janthinobacterium lividum]